MSKYNRVHQLGFVVPDMEAAMDFYGAVYGVKRWYRPVNEPQGELFFEGRPFSDPGYDMAIGYCGKTEIELITVGKVDNLYSRYLAQNPAGASTTSASLSGIWTPGWRNTRPRASRSPRTAS